MSSDVLMDYFSDIATPLDILETVARECDWPFERLSENVLTLDVEGRWTSCTLKFEWQEQFEALKFSCVADLKVSAPDKNRIAHNSFGS